MEPKDSFVTVKPKSQLIKNHIAYYYFHKSELIDFSNKFQYYPNYKNALTIYKHSNIKYQGNHSMSYPDKTTPFYMAYSGVQSQPRIAEIKAPFNKIGIIFQPLGLHHFIKEDLKKIISQTEDKTFNYFGDPLTKSCKLIYETNSIDEKVQLLDAFFTTHYANFNEERLKRAVQLLLEPEQEYTVQGLAGTLQIHRKTLLRLFIKHLNCTVKDYIGIIQFRKALNQYQNAENKPQFVELAYKSNYYDQSNFINHFKKITGFNPKRLFKGMDHIGNEDTFFTFLKN